MRVLSLLLPAILVLPLQAQPEKPKLYLDPINVNIPHIASDKTVKYDYRSFRRNQSEECLLSLAA